MSYLFSAYVNDAKNNESLFKQLVHIVEGNIVEIRVRSLNFKRNISLFSDVLDCISKDLEDFYREKVKLKIYNIDEEGPFICMAILEDSNKLKRDMMEIEDDYMLGSCIDINIYNEEGHRISRGDLGVKDRYCIYCGVDESETRVQDHNTNEYLMYIRELLEEHKHIYSMMVNE